MRLAVVLSISLVALLVAGIEDAHAQNQNQTTSKDDPKLGWSNMSDLSLVVTGGNSESTTVGLSDKVAYRWKEARFEFEVSVLHSNKSDDRFFLIEPGLEFPVGGTPSSLTTSLVSPEPTLDVANYAIQGTYERNISPKWFWNTGGSWYRNENAGIRNRYVVFAGLGNTWADNTRRRFVTNYGLSYTEREDVELDPERDRQFGGTRFAWDYTEHFNAATTFDSDFVVNAKSSRPADYSFSTLNALTVSMNTHVSIKVSLQWLFENKPALETDLDVIAYVELSNPDGVPGTGDERFRTRSSGGTKLVLGSSEARKDKLDTVVRTALVIKF